ncbi:MAG: hypothetical protein BJ554DRAFT_8286 [Olpidium bornovanus]|uniref:Uncharacterized protein n=1 Tax=Olpidium bornovanus TaxID=278681 RepID=A0A8H8DIK9_9FUNG|nr:MAG: hypothetical protein BJ554DRAFT_8286 [Olpidium bornovanus]
MPQPPRRLSRTRLTSRGGPRPRGRTKVRAPRAIPGTDRAGALHLATPRPMSAHGCPPLRLERSSGQSPERQRSGVATVAGRRIPDRPDRPDRKASDYRRDQSAIKRSGADLARSYVTKQPPALFFLAFANGRFPGLISPWLAFSCRARLEWAAIESSFTDTLKYTFRCQRREWDASVEYFHDLRVNFKAFLERPDQKQELVEAFQKQYNEMDDDLRSDLDAKAELHQRAEELRDRLWAISDKRKEEAEAERQGYIDDRWVDDHFAIMNNVYVTMMQAEVDRYAGTKHFLLDYYRDACGAVSTGRPSSCFPHLFRLFAGCAMLLLFAFLQDADAHRMVLFGNRGDFRS